MSNQKVSLPKGTRDFGSDQMSKRNFIFDTIKNVYKKYGFMPLETPAMENLSVLMGKYGEEGDKLLFKILNSGDFFSKATDEDIAEGSNALMKKISEKGLRYDLTVPFARYVAMNQHAISFPFRRYQMQPVWRADRPQKGRYREFYQCDADVVGTNSLLCEAEIIMMLQTAFADLGIHDVTIKMNNRKILSGITEVIGASGRETDFCVAIDKLDKIGREGVEKELLDKGFGEKALRMIDPLFSLTLNNEANLEILRQFLAKSDTGLKGIEELKEVFRMASELGADFSKLSFDVTLARGLSYYTGAIFEVKANNVQMGSICGGGRYDSLTDTFGLPNMSGVGISFGIDRIYDVMEELRIFPHHTNLSTHLMIATFDQTAFDFALPLLKELREAGISTELYPDAVKMKKQMKYANDKHIPYVAMIGEEEMEQHKLSVKNMQNGEQRMMTIKELIKEINRHE